MPPSPGWGTRGTGGWGWPREPDADTADSTASKTQQVSCFCPPCPQMCPKNEWARAQALKSVLTRAAMTADETNAGGVPPARAQMFSWGHPSRHKALKAILPAPEVPLVTCPNANPRLQLFTPVFRSSYPVSISAQVPSITPTLVSFIESPFRDPAALWMPVTQNSGRGGGRVRLPSFQCFCLETTPKWALSPTKQAAPRRKVAQ